MPRSGSVSVTKVPHRGLTDLFLADLQVQCSVDPREPARERLVAGSGPSLARRYGLDCLLCYFVFGPAVVAFWRGTWDFALLNWPVVLEANFEVDNLSKIDLYLN